MARFLAPSGLGRLDPARGLVVAGTDSGPGSEVSGAGEPGHVRAGLGNDDVGDEGADPRDPADQLVEPAKGLDHLLDLLGQLRDGAGVLADQAQAHPEQERVLVAEPPGQCLDQLRGLVTPVMSVATEESLLPASSSSFSNRWTSRERSRPWGALWAHFEFRSAALAARGSPRERTDRTEDRCAVDGGRALGPFGGRRALSAPALDRRWVGTGSEPLRDCSVSPARRADD